MGLGAAPSRIRAAIGPTIAQSSYEVDEAFRGNFADGDGRFFAFGRPGHRQFDLPAYVAHRLREAGIVSADDLALDTYVDPSRFFSYRRATHCGGDSGGRQLSVIALS
jgi:copper oxidase (laccase) domain-containing protein